MSLAEAREQALDVAEDAILRRARILDGQEPEVATELRELVKRLDVSHFEDRRPGYGQRRRK